MTDVDVAWMHEALQLAEEAAREGEVPVGAVAVHQGQAVGRGRNRREGSGDPFAHAEMEALAAAVRALGRWRLTGVTLYVTLEPCSMCVGAMLLSRIDRVAFGAPSPKAGALGGLLDLTRAPHNHRFESEGGIAAEECASLLRRFFGDLRAAAEDERAV
ncbi:MAG TPA: tRNA adenosine(34) deaminase TadA [Myxococcaceae bacterium]|nr:tRNA adenosine(34) deaminase TadA [Myxococcaceae bacterium]